MITPLKFLRPLAARLWASIRAFATAPIHSSISKNEMFRTLVQSFRDQPVTVHDIDNGGRVLFANEAACAHFGVDMATLLTWIPGDFDPQVTAQHFEDEKAFIEVGTHRFESLHRIASGEVIPVEITANYVNHRGRCLSICLTRDLRPERDAEALRVEAERAAAERSGLLRLAQFAASAPGFMYISELHADGKEVMTYASPAGKEVLGIEAAQLMGGPGQFYEALLPEDAGRMRDACGVSARDLAPLNEECRILHPEKGTRWIEIRAMPERMLGGVVAWHGFIYDITGRKAAERHLEETRARLQGVLRTIPDLVWMKDTDGIYMACNHAFENLFNACEADIVGRTDASFVVPGLADVFGDRDKAAIEAGTMVMHEEQVTFAADVGDVLLETRRVPVHGEDGRIIGILGIGRDITRRKKMEEELARSERNFRALAENAPDNIARYDREARLVYMNPVLERTMGVAGTVFLGRRPVEVYPESPGMLAYEEKLLQVLKTGVPAEFEMVSDPIGASRPLYDLIRIAPEFDESGEICGAVAIGRDYTEQKRLEQELALREWEFRTLAENSPDMIIRYDLECRRTYVNQAFLNATGVANADEILGQSVTSVGWWSINYSAADFEEYLRRVIRTGSPVSIQLFGYVPSTNLPRHTLVRIVPEFNTDGSVRSMLAFVRDVTDMVQLQIDIADRERQFRTLVENTPDVIIRYGRDLRRIWISSNYEQVFGQPVSSALGARPTEAWGKPVMSPEEYEARLKHVVDTGVAETIELDWYDLNGEYVCQALRVVPEFDPNGEVCSVLTLSRDVSEIKRATIRMLASEQEYRTLVEHSPEMVIRYDDTCRIQFVNSAFEETWGISRAQAQTGSHEEHWPAQNISSADYIEQLKAVMRSGEPSNILLEWTARNGKPLSFDMRVVPEYDAHAHVKGTLVIGHNISRIREAEAALRLREQEFRTLVENSPDTICRYDLQCRRIYANPKMIEEFGVGSAWVINKTPMEFPGGESSYIYEKHIVRVITTGETVDFELNWSNAAGKGFCTHLRLSPEFDSHGVVSGVLAVGRDISEIDEYRRRVHHMAFYDGLTELPNRALLNDRIGQTIADATYHGHRFGLMMMDLDGFKEVNDTLGHAVGDRLLAGVGERLLGCVRIYDTVARLGGDEFAVLLPEVREDESVAVIARKILDILVEPFSIDGSEIFISASIGIAVYPTDSEEIDGLFRYADSAMYHAKKQGRNNYQFYSAELTARSSERMMLESELRRAEKNKDFELHYQPQVDMISGRLVGVEALLRWARQDKSAVPPDRFIPIAEETGLIVGIGEWVLETACKTAVLWNRGRKSPLKVSVNLSSRQFVRNDLVGSIREIMDRTGCRAEWIGLEITESLLLDDAEDIRWTLSELDAMGLSIAIDDFGTGYSALGYLNRFPIGVLKIDRSFVRDITTDRDRAELVKAIVSMARSLRKRLIAEGVETDAQAAYLSNLGCHVVQGYLFGKPMPLDEIEKLIVQDAMPSQTAGQLK